MNSSLMGDTTATLKSRRKSVDHCTTQQTRSAMRYEFTPTAVTTEQITRSVLQCLGRLQQQSQLDDDAHDDFSSVRAMLEAMPLSTIEPL
jgi:hypothetical protein